MLSSFFFSLVIGTLIGIFLYDLYKLHKDKFEYIETKEIPLITFHLPEEYDLCISWSQGKIRIKK